MVHQMVKVIVHFVDRKTGLPWDGPNARARLYDADPLVDDFLGEAAVENGQAEIIFNLDDARSLDTPREIEPDLYVVLKVGKREILRTPIHHDCDFLVRDPRTDQLATLTQDLGTYEVG